MSLTRVFSSFVFFFWGGGGSYPQVLGRKGASPVPCLCSAVPRYPTLLAGIPAAARYVMLFLWDEVGCGSQVCTNSHVTNDFLKD